jgi:hypothetical protein
LDEMVGWNLCYYVFRTKADNNEVEWLGWNLCYYVFRMTADTAATARILFVDRGRDNIQMERRNARL